MPDPSRFATLSLRCPQLDPLALQFPNERDGAIGVKFVEAAAASSQAIGTWTDAEPPIKGES